MRARLRWGTIGGIVFVDLIGLIFAGYGFNWDWPGFNEHLGPQFPQDRPTKTLWDWLQLLFVPGVLTLGAMWFMARQNRDRKIARDIALDNQQEAELQHYLDKMSELLLVHDLRNSSEYAEGGKIARVRTLTILPRLDAERKGNVLRFLHESELIDKDKRIIDLSEANLSEAHLIDANLSEAHLREADLRGADLRGAFLRGADLRGADLSEADLRGADLSDADLQFSGLGGANLRKASVTREQLDQASVLKGTIMPDGSKHP
jgi:uncharacterized protein YjbI with pentapeptide repeats